jgi:hypothetical protein
MKKGLQKLQFISILLLYLLLVSNLGLSAKRKKGTVKSKKKNSIVLKNLSLPFDTTNKSRLEKDLILSYQKSLVDKLHGVVEQPSFGIVTNEMIVRDTKQLLSKYYYLKNNLEINQKTLDSLYALKNYIGLDEINLIMLERINKHEEISSNYFNKYKIKPSVNYIDSVYKAEKFPKK